MATPTEVADLLRVPVKTLYQWRYHGKGLRAYRVGRHLRCRWEDVEAWARVNRGGEIRLNPTPGHPGEPQLFPGGLRNLRIKSPIGEGRSES